MEMVAVRAEVGTAEARAETAAAAGAVGAVYTLGDAVMEVLIVRVEVHSVVSVTPAAAPVLDGVAGVLVIFAAVLSVVVGAAAEEDALVAAEDEAALVGWAPEAAPE